jgi:hypothetical protein
VGGAAMTEPLPLSDADKLALCKRLEEFGLLRRDAYGRFRITHEGNVAGLMPYAIAMVEQADLAARSGRSRSRRARV